MAGEDTQNQQDPEDEIELKPQQVFDISDDSISPIKDTDAAATDASSAKPASNGEAAVPSSLATAVKSGNSDLQNSGQVKKETPNASVGGVSPFSPEYFNSAASNFGAGFGVKSITPSTPASEAPKTETAQNTVAPQISGTVQKSDLQGTVSSMVSDIFKKIVAEKPKLTLNIPVDPHLEPLRTYESDVAEVMARHKTSTVSMALAESEKKGEGQRIANVPETKTEIKEEKKIAEAAKTDRPRGSSHALGKTFIIVAIIILIAVGAGGGYYLYSQSPLAAPAPKANTATTQNVAPALIKTDAQVVIPIDNLEQSQIIALVKTEMAKSQPAGTIKNIVLTETQNSQTVQVSPMDLIATMGIPVPDIITRTLEPQWMLGVYADSAGNKSPIVIVKTNFFQNAFAGMLQWESTMPEDLRQYVAPVVAVSTAPIITPSVAVATSTAHDVASSTKTKDAASSTNLTGSSTATTAPVSAVTNTAALSSQYYSSLPGQFTNRIIENTDVREFVAPDGTILFMYSFINNSTLVFTGSEAALSEVAMRLEQQAFTR